MADLVMILLAILSGVLAGAVAAVVGWIKHREWEQFHGPAFVKTVLIGAILGGVAGGLGVSPIEAQTLLMDLGLFAAVVAFAEFLANAIWRRVILPLAAPSG